MHLSPVLSLKDIARVTKEVTKAGIDIRGHKTNKQKKATGAANILERKGQFWRERL
jgi:hypothetical protein